MSYVLTTPEMLAAAATDVGNIGSTISTASSNAAGPTAGLLPAAEDEVSAAIAKLFGAYGQEYQAVVSQATAFHNEFTQALAAAGNAYLEAEAANSALTSGPSNALNTITGGPSGVSAMTSTATASADPLIALIMGGTGNPTPDPGNVTSIFNSYVQPNPLFSGAIPQGLFTPEQFWPIAPSLGNLTFGQSVALGGNVLNTGLVAPTGMLAQGNSALIFGYSQSATVATNEITALMATGAPSDRIANAPQYPLNVVSHLTAVQVGNTAPLPTSPGYTGSTQYYEFLTQALPLLQPIRDIAVDSARPLTRGG
jgi:PE family/PE-PPE domain